jgi:hypothetical protein
MKERRNEGEHGGCIYENTIIKPVEIVLRRGKEDRGGTRQGVKLRYIVNIYVNITMYPLVQLLYADKKQKFKKEIHSPMYWQNNYLKMNVRQS